MPSARRRPTTDHIHLGYGQAGRRSAAVVLGIKIKLEKVAAELAFLSFSIFPTKDINVGMDKSHCAADLRVKDALYIGDLLP